MRTPTKTKQTDPDVEQADASLTPPRRPTTNQEVSPAPTFDTALTSPSRTFDSIDSPKPQKITIDVKNSAGNGGARSAGLLFGMSKPFLGIMGLLLLGAGGAAAFGWFQIPGLKTQVQRLEEQVGLLNQEINRLTSEVDRLQGENDRYESLNDELNRTVIEFQIITDDLNSTVTELEGVAGDLNETNQELSDRVDELADENEVYARLNQELNETANQLSQELDFFEAALAQMVIENEVLSNLTDVLEDMTSRLGNLTLEQNETLIELKETLDSFIAENDRLEDLNGDLVTIVAFLNDTSSGLGDSLEQVTQFLATQIEANQVLVVESLELSYRQKLTNWDCEYRDIFREEAFGADFSLPITDLDSVLEYLDGRILSELCLDEVDFENYLLDTFPDGISTFRLTRGVLEYTTAALDYYFPEDGESGVSYSDWEDAAFRCENLPQPFSI